MHIAGSGSSAIAQAASSGDLLQSGIQHSHPKAAFESLMKVADFPELIFDPTLLDLLLKLTECRRRRIAFRQRIESRFGREHATLDGEVNAFQALRIQEAGGVAENHPSVTRDWRNRPPSAVGQRLCAIADHLAHPRAGRR